ncbi:BNR repeat-containing protein [Sphingomonas sp. RS2018]
MRTRCAGSIGVLRAAWVSGALLASSISPVAAQTPAKTATVSAIDRVWSGHSVGFALVVTKERIFAGYYDANRQLTVASRPRRFAAWVYHKLDSWVGWDSHNYIAMAVDSVGQVHVAANMHGDPLVYYRTTAAGDVRTMTRRAVMVDPPREQRMTYPIFLHDAAGRLIFKYRDGSSGNGNEIYNVLDAASGQWAPLLSQPLADGEGRRNAYFVGPVAGPDGRFHIAWVWRETPMAETNHDLSYARSRDLVHWERSDGTALTLPIRLSSAEIVDAVPVRGGMINNNTLVGFDQAGRVLIAYHKFDAAGQTQIYLARREGNRWRIAQASDWRDFRWDFRGGGSLDSRLVLKAPVADGPNRIRLSLIRDGKPIDLLLDTTTLARVEERSAVTLAATLATAMPPPAGMGIETVEDAGGSGIALAWATRPPQRDRPSGDIPAPTILYLIDR